MICGCFVFASSFFFFFFFFLAFSFLCLEFLYGLFFLIFWGGKSEQVWIPQTCLEEISPYLRKPTPRKILYLNPLTHMWHSNIIMHMFDPPYVCLAACRRKIWVAIMRLAQLRLATTTIQLPIDALPCSPCWQFAACCRQTPWYFNRSQLRTWNKLHKWPVMALIL